MILRGHPAPGRGAQRGDRDRAGVVGVVLAGVPRRQQPHPGGHLGLDVQDHFPGREELLGQQVPQPGAPSTAQVRSGQTAAQASSCSACAAGARTGTSPSGSPAGPTAAAVCDALWGSTPIITAAINGLLLTPGTGRNRGGHA